MGPGGGPRLAVVTQIWVTQSERPSAANDEVKRPKGLQLEVGPGVHNHVLQYKHRVVHYEISVSHCITFIPPRPPRLGRRWPASQSTYSTSSQIYLSSYLCVQPNIYNFLELGRFQIVQWGLSSKLLFRSFTFDAEPQFFTILKWSSRQTKKIHKLEELSISTHILENYAFLRRYFWKHVLTNLSWFSRNDHHTPDHSCHRKKQESK